MSSTISELNKDDNPLDSGSASALAKIVGPRNVGKAQDAMARRKKGETVPNTIDSATSSINDIAIDIVNAGPGAVERLLRLHQEVQGQKADDPDNVDAIDQEKDRRMSDVNKNESLDELLQLAGLREFDSSVNSKAGQIGRDIGATTTGQQFAQASDDIENKSSLTGKSLEALRPYIKYIAHIMGDSALFGKFKLLIMQAKKDMEMSSPAESLDLADVKEGFEYGMPTADSQTGGSVSFKQERNTDKGSVTIDASGDDMQALADVLKLAGVEMPQLNKQDDEEHAHDEEPVDPFDKDGDDKCDGCGREIVDGECGCDDHDHGEEEPKTASMKLAVRPEMSTDKQVLVNYLKDKLAKSLS